jgi:hypothetical protein
MRFLLRRKAMSSFHIGSKRRALFHVNALAVLVQPRTKQTDGKLPRTQDSAAPLVNPKSAAVAVILVTDFRDVAGSRMDRPERLKVEAEASARLFLATAGKRQVAPRWRSALAALGRRRSDHWAGFESINNRRNG